MPQAVVEQSDVRIAALKREAHEFKKEVVVGGQHPRSGKTLAEKVLKYFDDALRAKDALAEKLRLKNQALLGQKVKLEAAARQKEDGAGADVLHYIDFHQLQIENKQFLAKIEERNNELLRLKLSTGRTVQTLNGMKSRLSEAARRILRLRGDMKARATLLHRLQAENGAMAVAVHSSVALAGTLARAAAAAADLPTVLDYVELTALQAGLAREVASWRRKLEIAELTARQATLKAQQAGIPVPPLSATAPAVPLAVPGLPASTATAALAAAAAGAGFRRGALSAPSAGGAMTAASAATRRSGRMLGDVDVFSGDSGTATPSGPATRRAPGSAASASSAASAMSSLPPSAASSACRTPAPPHLHSPLGSRPPLSRAHTAAASSAVGGARAGVGGGGGGGHRPRSSVSGDGRALVRPVGGAGTARSLVGPAVPDSGFGGGAAGGPLLLPPRSVSGFGGAGKGTLRLGPASSRGGGGMGRH